MPDIRIRHANAADDFLSIASCIYLTDPFIFPSAFGTDTQQAAYAISKLVSIENGLFCPDNLVLALHGEKICGVLLYNKHGAVWDREQCGDFVRGIVPSIENFNYVSDMYFSVEAATPPKNHIEVIACCVMPEFRNLGIGKHMLDWLIEECSTDILALDVLANNPAAISLYEKCGFKVIEAYKGFSLEEATRPDCYHMVRNPDNLG